MAKAKIPTQSTNHDRSIIARIGAHTLHSKYDSREITRNARKEFMNRFEREVDPDERLSEGERKRRADQAKTAYFTRLGRASGKARRRGQ